MKKLSVDQALLKAKFHTKNGEFEDAQKLYQVVLLAFPKNKRAQRGLVALNKSKKPATTKGPPQETINQLVNSYNQGQLLAAKEQAQKLLEQYPEDFFVWNILGAVHKASGKTFEASQAFKKVTELNPNYADGHSNFGITLKEQGKLAEAIKEYNKALSIRPNFVEVYNNMGAALQGQNKLNEAIEVYRKALSLKPDYSEAHNNMGTALQEQGKFQEAIEAFRKALLFKTNYAEAFNNMGNALKDQKKFDEAIKAYNKALSIKPDYAEAFNNMGNALIGQSKLEEAIKVYGRSIAIMPDHAEAYYNMGNALFEQSKFNQAIEAYEKVLYIKPDYANAARNLVKFPIGSIDEKTIVKLSKNLPSICANIVDQSERLFFKANLLYHKGEYDEAFKVFIDANYIQSNRFISSMKSAQKKYNAAVKRIGKWSVNLQPERKGSVKKIFFLGPSRSGKSILEKLLINSPNVCPMFENINLDALGDMEPLREGYTKPNMADIFYNNENSLINRGYEVITSTNPESIFYIDKLIDTFNDSFFILLKRNRIDVASEIFIKEYRNGNYYSYDHLSISKYLDSYEAIWEILKQKVPEYTLEISFEDILIDPQDTLKKISDLTSLNFQIDYTQNNSLTNFVKPFKEYYASCFMSP
jgi:tetratricopeptide (TPR) repeat protein